MNAWILLPVLPAVAGTSCRLLPEHLAGQARKTDGELSTRMGKLHAIFAVVLVLTTVLALLVAWSGEHEVTILLMGYSGIFSH
ncbi:MAG: hypothetical protein ACLURV_07080 [Gallintestinimicrobium sp.]